MIRLSEGWSLTDGIVQPTALAKPQGVVRALTEAGVLAEPERGLNSLSCEWVSARRWTYGLTFSRPEGDLMRAFYLENLCGEGCVRLNGKKLADFCDQNLWVECTDELLEGENRLEVVFEARLRTLPGWDALPEIGLCGDVYLHESEDARIEALEVLSGEAARVTCRIARRRGQEFTLRARLRTDGGLLAEREIPVRLSERHETVSCELPLAGAPTWSERAPEEGILCLEAALFRGDTLCDEASLEFARPDRPVTRAVQVDAYRADAQAALLMERLGAQACVPLRGRPGRLVGGLVGGIPCAAYRQGAPYSAMQREGLLKELCGGAEYWPPEEAIVWRLRSKVSDEPPAEACAAPFEAACRYQRAMQAENLRALAEEKRLRGEMLQVRLDDADWKAASRALIDQDGTERSAYWALSQAWGPAHVCLREKGEGVFEVCLLGDGAVRDVMRIQVSAYDVRGGLVSGREFVALSEGNGLLGEVHAPFPEGEELLLLRTVLRDSRGETVEVCDRLAFRASDDEARLRALTERPCELEETEASLKNTSDAACLCLRAGDEYGFLLPGEVRKGARLRGAEWINREE